jgi:hypothetical protein
MKQKFAKYQADFRIGKTVLSGNVRACKLAACPTERKRYILLATAAKGAETERIERVLLVGFEPLVRLQPSFGNELTRERKVGSGMIGCIVMAGYNGL